jgi:hypothetical protein
MNNCDIELKIKKKWFDMILSGEKKEEYRTYDEYYHCRIGGALYRKNKETKKFPNFYAYNPFLRGLEEDFLTVKFKNGYNSNSPSFIAKCRVFVRTGGKEEWGASLDNNYYVFEILEIKSEN